MTECLKDYWGLHRIEQPWHSFFFCQAIQCSILLSFLIDPCNEYQVNAPKPDGFRALGVETPLRLTNSSQKGYRIGLSHDFFFFFFLIPRYLSNKSPSFTQNIESIHNQVHMSYLTNYVLMCSWQFKLKQVNAQMPKISNKTQNPNHMVMCSTF